jgi:levansucrase
LQSFVEIVAMCDNNPFQEGIIALSMSSTIASVHSDTTRSPSLWTREHLALLHDLTPFSAPLIGSGDVKRVCDNLDLWDIWPLQNPDGSVANVARGSLWMILSAPVLPDPNERHNKARTRLLHHLDGKWHDCGNLFPDSLNPGGREWSGSALYDDATGTITAFFTAAGRKGDTGQSFEQRLFQSTGTLDLSGDKPWITGWSAAKPSVINDGRYYVDLAIEQGVPGNIRGFRDPFWFRDPATGLTWLLFTGSLAGAATTYSGVVGLAAANSSDGISSFDLVPPIVSADGLANELERPHMFVRDGLYYLFWSSQSSIFAPDGPPAPSGLYGMVGPSITGPFEPLNGTGLVICNPESEPKQAYCWQVLDTLEVISFVDHWSLEGRDPASDADLNRAHFGGTIAPMLKIEIKGNTTRLLGLA